MKADARKYELGLTSVGPGSFGTVEYDGTTKVVLRVAGIKSSEVSGSVRMYFDQKRAEVISGRRFEPLSSHLLRPMVVYKFMTTIRVVDIPDDVTLKVTLIDDAKDVMMLVHDEPIIGDDGMLSIMVMPFRRIDIERMTAPARLYFEVENAPVKKSVPKQTPKKKSAAPKSEVKDEGDVSDERTDTPANGRL